MLHLARGEGRECYFSCNLMQRKVLASSHQQPIVKSVCVIRECVVVVEFERASFSRAVGWATFSGTGTYTLYVHRGNVEEVVFSGRVSRAGRMSPSTYIEALQKNGWCLKARGSGMGRPE